MAKKFKNITLKKRRTTVEIKDFDGWMFDLRYLVNGKETYSCQILKPEVSRRVEILESEGFTKAIAP